MTVLRAAAVALLLLAGCASAPMAPAPVETRSALIHVSWNPQGQVEPILEMYTVRLLFVTPDPKQFVDETFTFWPAQKETILMEQVDYLSSGDHVLRLEAYKGLFVPESPTVGGSFTASFRGEDCPNGSLLLDATLHSDGDALNFDGGLKTSLPCIA